MKLKMPKIVSVLLAAVALAVSVPVSAFAAQTRDEPIEIVCYTPAVLADDGSVVQDAQEVYSEVLNLDGSITLPTTANGRSVVCWSTVNGNIKVPAGVAYNAATLQNQLYDDWGLDMPIVVAALYAQFDGNAQTPVTLPATDTAPVDTRTPQQKEIDEMIANGTWEEGYTTCQACGYHNWTRQGNVYVCDNCGNTVTEVVSAKNVKGYVGSGAIAPVAAAADTTPQYATAQEAQAAADKREAAYAAAVAAFQKQIAAQNAAYLAALKG